MAELAYEAVVRLIISLIVLSLIVLFIKNIFYEIKGKLEVEGLVKIDASDLDVDILSRIMEKCGVGVARKDCALILNVDDSVRKLLEENNVTVLSNSTNGLLYYEDGSFFFE